MLCFLQLPVHLCGGWHVPSATWEYLAGKLLAPCHPSFSGVGTEEWWRWLCRSWLGFGDPMATCMTLSRACSFSALVLHPLLLLELFFFFLVAKTWHLDLLELSSNNSKSYFLALCPFRKETHGLIFSGFVQARMEGLSRAVKFSL